MSKLKKKEYEKELKNLQVELVKLQEWVKHKGLKVVVLFEGRDAAGKGGSELQKSTRVFVAWLCLHRQKKKKTQWYFQRYVAHLPSAGEIVLFDRSWYNRAGVEKVMGGFCTPDEYEEFLRSCPEFERMLQRSGIILIKYWFSVSDEEQEKRFLGRINTPIKRWKFSPMDLESRHRWAEYSEAKDKMFAYTDTKNCWWVVPSDDKKKARLNCISHLLSQIDYKALEYSPIELPELNKEGYVRAPIDDQTFVPDKY
ncbi:LOW QUALITY PROTEIN: hypothetical protein JCM18904_2678 [Vibrio sp. JCM 18904]|nr:LOW QUALITY PROTEIN: hypothetical protein JCM18904_2678 [Vibrio sp. JCM 18904]